MGRRNLFSKSKADIYPECETVKKRSQVSAMKRTRKQNETLRRKFLPGISLLWHEARDRSCCRLLNLHAMWWLIRLSNPPIVLSQSYIPGARLGVFTTTSYNMDKGSILLPIDNLTIKI